MWRYALTVIVALGLVGIGIESFLKDQIVMGIIFIGIAVLRTGAIFSGRKRATPQPSIRLNLEDQEEHKKS